VYEPINNKLLKVINVVVPVIKILLKIEKELFDIPVKYTWFEKFWKSNEKTPGSKNEELWFIDNVVDPLK